MNLSRWLPRPGKDYRAARDYLARLGSWDARTTAAAQLARLREVWADCVQDVPYYSGLVAHREAPGEIRDWADFQGIPELTRGILQERPALFQRRSGPPDLVRTTGGSTGTPVRFGVWTAEDRVLRMLKLVLWARAGYQPKDRLFLIWGHSHLLGTGWKRHLRHIQRKLKDRLLGYQRVDAYKLSPARCVAIARRLIAFRPAGLIGYASALDYFARMTGAFHAEFRRLGCRFVMPAAEPPPKPDTFPLLRELFRCPVVQEFGGVDFGQVGMKVDDELFSVFPEHNLLEAVPDKGQRADEGAALVTTLYRRYVPLIRYRQGDLLRGVQRLEHGHVHSFAEIAGRANDMVPLPGGIVVHSVAFLHCIHQEPSVLNGQLLIDDGGTALRLVVGESYNSACEMRIRQRMGQLDSGLANLRIELVGDLETSIAGKRRWYVDNRTGAGGRSSEGRP